MTGDTYSHLLLLNRVLWAVSGILCLAVLIAALWNKRIRTFPLFFGLVGFYPIEFLLFFTIQHSHSYTVWAWSMSSLLIALFLLELAVLYQLANIVVFSHAPLAKHLKSLRRWTLVVLVLSTTIIAAMGHDISQDAGTSAFARLFLAQDFLEACLLIFLIIIRRTLAIPWKALPIGITIGWGASAVFDLSADAIVRVTTCSMLGENLIRATGFNACVLIWLWYTARQPSPAPAIANKGPAIDLHHEIIEAQRTLRTLTGSGKGE